MRSNILRNRAMFCSQVSTPPITSTPLCFEAEEANSTVYYSVTGTLATLDMKYSTDGTTWTAWGEGSGNAITLASIGDKVYIKGNNASGLSTDYSNFVNFVMTGKIAASGNINSLLDDGDGSTISAIPGTYCYSSMFYGCTSLTTAPELPATTLTNNCYYGMFYGCSKLNYIKISYTGNFSTTYMTNWVYNVQTVAGSFYYNGADTTRGASAIPTNWTIITF